MHLIYALFAALAFPLLVPFLLLHPKIRHGVRQRLGFYPPDWPGGQGRQPRVWFHGASAGDLLSLLPMVQELRRRAPQAFIVVSTMTNSGHAIARQRFREADAITYQPYDLAGATRRAMAAIQPDLLVLEYTEVWPNLIHAARRAGALVVMTNGRFSPDRLAGYGLLFRLIGNTLREIDLLLMREDDEAERALALGAPLERVWVTGNTKFDALVLSEPGEGDAALAGALDAGAGPLWVAGSTHEGEEGILLDVFRELRKDFPALRLVIAPRYVERASKILSLARERDFKAGLRTQGAAKSDVIVLDTIGELVRAYRLAALVFVGGSFTTRGGQNILEPAAQGKPVLFGPHMENFHDSVQVLVGRGGIQVNDARHLERVAHDLLSRPAALAELGELAKNAVMSVRGASARNVERMLKLLAERRSAPASLRDASAHGDRMEVA